MPLLPTIIAALSLLLPSTGGERGAAVGPGASRALTPAVGLQHADCFVRRPVPLPSSSRLFVEGLDENALEEEDSDDLDFPTSLSYLVFGEKTFSTLLLSPVSPQRDRSSRVPSPSVLRC